MKDRIVTSFGSSRGYSLQEERYVHKYYLPPELKKLIRPADIGALVGGREGKERFATTGPLEPPDVVIHYQDLVMEKKVAAPVVRRVLLAHRRYLLDCRAELSPAEVGAALALNARLSELENSLLGECTRLTEEMEQRLRGNDPFLKDYEIQLEISFHLRDDDPLAAEDNPAHADDPDMDAALMAVANLRGRLTAEEAADPEYYGIGDHQDHSDWPPGTGALNNIRHCALFHELYDHLHIPLKHLGCIGRVWADIRVVHQTVQDGTGGCAGGHCCNPAGYGAVSACSC